jgi:2-haloacid dehalogenase
MGLNFPLRMQPQPPVRGVLLDVFGTLFSPVRLHAAFAAGGLDPALVPHWIMRAMSDGIALAAAEDYRHFGEVATSALLALAPGRLDRTGAQTIVAAFQELDPYPDVAEGLALLRRAGVRVMTLTSAERVWSEELFCRACLDDMVDGFLSVETVRRWKPAPEAYAYGVAQIGWPAGQVALISAHEWDIHGARRFGLRTGHIGRYATSPRPIFDRADVGGPDLPAVVQQLLADKASS